jgi:PAS domain S-box-containing protein
VLVSKSVTVLVADDDAAVRQALADLISDEPGLRLVAVASSADEAIQLAAEHQPAVAVLDVRMPGGGGPRAAEGIRVCSPQTRILALSAHEEKASVYEMLSVGASGYLVKGSSDKELVDAIYRATRGQFNMSATLATSCFRELLHDIQAREQAETVLRRSEDKFRALLESAPDAMVIVNGNGLIEGVNMQVERLFAYKRGELLGHQVEMLLPARFRGAHVAHRERYAAAPEPRPMGAGLELSGRRKDGSEFPVEITLSPLDTEQGQLVVSAIRDITDRKLAVEVQRKSEEQFRALIESSPDGMVMVDTSGVIHQVNAETETLFGYGRDELIGRPLETLVPERFHQAHVFHRGKYFDAPTERKMGIREMAGRRKDGTEFPVDISLSYLSTDAGRLATARVRDISDRKRVEAELEASFELVRKAGVERQELLGHLVRAEEAERLRISSDIHDDSIQAMAAAGLRLQQFRKRVTAANEVEALDKLEEAIEGSIDRLRHLMFDLRPINLDRAGLAAALRAQLERIRSDVGLEFEVENRVTSEPPSETRFILYRIAMEALVNVRKHARAHRVQVRLADVNHGWHVQIDDDGDGFEPPNGGSVPGHLGLTAMRERAQIAGGWWKMESRPGSGTSISFWLPDVQQAPEFTLARLSA